MSGRHHIWKFALQEWDSCSVSGSSLTACPEIDQVLSPASHIQTVPDPSELGPAKCKPDLVGVLKGAADRGRSEFFDRRGPSRVLSTSALAKRGKFAVCENNNPIVRSFDTGMSNAPFIQQLGELSFVRPRVLITIGEEQQLESVSTPV